MTKSVQYYELFWTYIYVTRAWRVKHAELWCRLRGKFLEDDFFHFYVQVSKRHYLRWHHSLPLRYAMRKLLTQMSAILSYKVGFTQNFSTLSNPCSTLCYFWKGTKSCWSRLSKIKQRESVPIGRKISLYSIWITLI